MYSNTFIELMPDFVAKQDRLTRNGLDLLSKSLHFDR